MIKLIYPKVELITPISQLTEYPKLIEQIGRVCYKSEDRIQEGSAARFIKNIIKRGHESVIEHCSISYKFICSRSCSHQLVRHRLCSFSQESMRYCDYTRGKLEVIIPSEVKTEHQRQLITNTYTQAYKTYIELRNSGLKPEDARFVLPHGTKTELVVSANIRQWRHVLKTRLDSHAQWEIRNLMNTILYELNFYLPTFFEDILK